MIVHLGRRVLALALVIAGLVGLISGVVAHLDPTLWSGLEAGAVFWFTVGTALMTAPFSTFVATTWSWHLLRASGQVAVLEASGHRPARLRRLLGWAAALALSGAALATEAFLPLARSTAGVRLSWELQAHRPTAFFSGEDRVVVRTGASLEHLSDVWRWREGLPTAWRELHWDGQGWKDREGALVPGLPSPLELIAARPYLSELLSVTELVSLGAQVRWKERLVRPFFWWLWIACALAALSAWPRPGPLSVLGLGLFLAAGVTLQGLSAELAFEATTEAGQFLALAMAPLVAGVLGWPLRRSDSLRDKGRKRSSRRRCW